MACRTGGGACEFFKICAKDVREADLEKLLQESAKDAKQWITAGGLSWCVMASCE